MTAGKITIVDGTETPAPEGVSLKLHQLATDVVVACAGVKGQLDEELSLLRDEVLLRAMRLASARRRSFVVADDIQRTAIVVLQSRFSQMTIANAYDGINFADN